MILTYRILTTILYPFLFLFVYYRIFIKKEDPKRFKEKILTSQFKIVKDDKSKLIWFHAASIGEFKSIIPIISEINTKNKNLRFLVTTTTVSSGDLAKTELKKFKNIEHRYFPFDVGFLFDNFLSLWKPEKIFLVDSEVWPNLLLKAQKYKIPVALINARLTSKSFNRWMFFPNIAKKIFGVFDLFICSNIKTQRFLEKLKLKNIYYKGNIKLADGINEKEISNFHEPILRKKKFWFAASTHQEEDIFCLKTHLELKKDFDSITTIIAPRHIDRVGKIKTLSQKFNLKTQILNKGETILNDKEVVIINYFGSLKEFFKFSKSVFIGKSLSQKFKNNGGQNPIEAAKLKCKIYHGPYVCNFEEIYDLLKKYNISNQIQDFKGLSENLTKDLKYPQEKNNQNFDAIQILGKTTLNDTVQIVEKFLKYDVN
tara:strand:- start:6916 stop:8199 length:1284 start_codon:yes stop_codon:yes gene_type:complete